MGVRGISKIMITGGTWSGKTAYLIEKYKYMVEEQGVPSENILVLLQNRTQILRWRNECVFSGSGHIWMTTYYGFIQCELKLFYPHLLKKCKDIALKDIEPVFLTHEAAQYLLTIVIDARRQREGLFEGVKAYSEKISMDLSRNLVTAAVNNVPYDKIGELLYSALDKKDSTKKQIYKDMDIVLSSYRQKCLELGVFDYSMAVEVFNKYLLNDIEYQKSLLKRVKYLIVDNVEEIVPSQADIVNLLLDKVDTCLVAYNNDGGCGLSFGGNCENISNKLSTKLNKVELKGSYCSEQLFHFADNLYSSIMQEKDDFKLLKNDSIERNDPVELRSEMLSRIGTRVCSLIERKI